MIKYVGFDKKQYVMYMSIKVSRHQQCLFIISLYLTFKEGWQKQGLELRSITVYLVENIEKPMLKLIPWNPYWLALLGTDTADSHTLYIPLILC